MKWLIVCLFFLSAFRETFPSTKDDLIDPDVWGFSFCQRISSTPVLGPHPAFFCTCPINGRQVNWAKKHVFNPAAIVRNGKVCLIYRAEDETGKGIGSHTSRLGFAESMDGLSFTCYPFPILFPDCDAQEEHEFPGGCEDPRIVEMETGGYLMTYTQWNRKVAALAIATSEDLVHWKKWGYAFSQEKRVKRRWSKSGSIICRQEGDRLIATKILGKYWMYWGDVTIHMAYSDELIHWNPLVLDDEALVNVLEPREGKFDSELVEPGPPALLTEHGIVLIYNGKNGRENGDFLLDPESYVVGQVLFDRNFPWVPISRTDEPLLKPEIDFERFGQYRQGAVFAQGLVHFENRWLLYYGAADSKIGVVSLEKQQTFFKGCDSVGDVADNCGIVTDEQKRERELLF